MTDLFSRTLQRPPFFGPEELKVGGQARNFCGDYPEVAESGRWLWILLRHADDRCWPNRSGCSKTTSWQASHWKLHTLWRQMFRT